MMIIIDETLMRAEEATSLAGATFRSVGAIAFSVGVAAEAGV